VTLRIRYSNFESIPEQHRSFYVEADHGWKLDCDFDEIVRSLKSALKDERSTRQRYERGLREILTAKGYSEFKRFCRNRVTRDAETSTGKVTTAAATAVAEV